MAAKKVEQKKPAAKKPAAKKVEHKKPLMFVSTRSLMAHPYQGVQFIPGVPVPCVEDVWLKCQKDAGLIKEVK